MTAAARPTPAQSRYSGWELEVMESYEGCGEPFTEAELDAIARYDQATLGVPDCFDPAVDGIGPVPEEFSEADVMKLMRAYLEMLSSWREAAAVLREELTDCSAARPPELSAAARRYISAELLTWHHAREKYRAGVIGRYLGQDQYGYGYDRAYDFPGSGPGCEYRDGEFWMSVRL